MKVVLRTWVIAYCKCIDLAYKEFSKGHVNDIEDIWMDHFGIAVHLDDAVEDVDAHLSGAISWVCDWGRKSFFQPGRLS
jgi:hypothetical protein